jgi:uncharacterized protein (DUF2336 family)
MDTLRRVTDLFLVQPQQFDDEQIALFDDVLTHMIARVETRARAELAKRLAPIDQAPNEVIRRLALDDEIAVAGPVLSQSARLTTADLVGIAEQKGQAHLLAIAGRTVVEQQVTDVLVNRGDRNVVHRLAANGGASFSETGYSKLVRRAESDEHLIEKLGRRIDIPLHFFRELLLKAGEAVRSRLMATLGPDRRDLVRQVVEEMSSQVAHQAPAARNIEAAQRLVEALKEQGRLKEPDVLTFAQRGKLDEVIASMALLCAVSCDLVDHCAAAAPTRCSSPARRSTSAGQQRGRYSGRARRDAPSRTSRTRRPNTSSCRHPPQRACCGSGRCGRQPTGKPAIRPPRQRPRNERWGLSTGSLRAAASTSRC